MAGTAEGATILITGATSGIGRATAIGLASRGSTLVLPVRNRDRGEAVAALARQAGAAGVEVLGCDMRARERAHRRTCRGDVMSLGSPLTGILPTSTLYASPKGDCR